MTSSRDVAKTLGKVAFACLVLVQAQVPSFAVTPQSWKSTPYFLSPGDTTLEQVFVDFRRLMNTPVELSDSVKGPTASLGQPSTVEGFLDSLAQRHGLVWFAFRNRLYVSTQAEASEVRIKVVATRMAEVRAYLNGIQLLDERFGWVELPSRDEVLVQGPPAYVALVRDSALSVKPAEPTGPPPPPPPEPQQIMTFRLQHASAGDDESGRPGVASLLSRLYGGGSSNLVPRSTRTLAEKLARKAVPAAASGSAPASDAPSVMATLSRSLERPVGIDAADSGGGAHGDADRRGRDPRDEMPSFEADPRLNMIIVRDKPSRRAEYERVIAALDVVTEQIALDATIIELPANSMRDALAAISANAAMATSASGMPALIAPRSVVERAFEQVSRARQTDGSAAIMTQGLVFSEDDPFSLDFADSRTLPQHSTTIWETLAASLIPIKVDSGDNERRIGIKLGGTAKYILNRGVSVKLELAEDRSTPEKRTKTTSARTTNAAMSVELREDQILVLVNSSVWSGEDMNEPRGRAVLLSAQRWQSHAPVQSMPPAALGSAPVHQFQPLPQQTPASNAEQPDASR
jgi:hypothetical protein